MVTIHTTTTTTATTTTTTTTTTTSTTTTTITNDDTHYRSSVDYVMEECKNAKDKVNGSFVDMNRVENMSKLNEKFLTHGIILLLSFLLFDHHYHHHHHHYHYHLLGAFMQTLLERLCMAINITGILLLLS